MSNRALEIDQKRCESRLQHVLFILDGNGRWASRRELPREEGHAAGAKNITTIVYECIEHSIQYMSLFVFSTENWKRPEKEVKGILKALADCLSSNLLDWHAHGVRIQYIGQLQRMDPHLQDLINYSRDLTQDNTVITVSIILDYGARSDIVAAMRHIVRERIPVEDITEQTVASYLSTACIPDPDLVIRTGGRFRISNVFLWELSYSELWFTDVLWPDFGPEHLRDAIDNFHGRPRTFGNVPELLALERNLV
jgi:undecaprenyl diphosphate synthase